MKSKPFKLILILILMMIVSCDEPETVVTNYVHPDGSVTRKIEMRNIKNNFKTSVLQVPFDSSWVVKDSIEINGKGDTTWVKKAEKLFKNVAELNLSYLTDSGANKKISRQALFVKKFRWFNTEFRFSENIDKTMSFGYPIKDYLTSEELNWFYSPDGIKHDKETGPDSLKYKALTDTLKKKVDIWTIKSLALDWMGEFAKLTEGKPGADSVKKSFEARKDEFVSLVTNNEKDFDSLWSNGIILKKFMGEKYYYKFKTDADTTIEKVTQTLSSDFKEYSVRIAMPGKLTGTNGFIDKSEVLLWPVKSDYFFTEPYLMWAQSKVPNRWAWIVSGLFLIFVLTGLIVKINRKG
jgi:hypothetical protein